MSDKMKSQSPSGNWLFYTEAAIIVLFVAVGFAYTRRGETQSSSLPTSQVQELIRRADKDFGNQNLVKAAVAYWQAIQSLESAKHDAPHSIDGLGDKLLHANLRVAEIYSHSNWVKDARKRLEYAAQIRPHDVDVRLLRGKLERDDGERTLAVKEFLSVIEKDSTNAEAHYLLGVMYQGAQQYQQAIKHYKKSIEHDHELTKLAFEAAPIGLLARLQLSRTYRRILQGYELINRDITTAEISTIGRMEEHGIAVLEDVVERDPNFTEAKDELVGLLYRRAAMIGREAETRPYDQALKIYQHIVELAPCETDAWKQIGEINFAFLHDKEAAMEAYQKAYRLDSDPYILAAIKNIETDLARENVGNLP